MDVFMHKNFELENQAPKNLRFTNHISNDINLIKATAPILTEPSLSMTTTILPFMPVLELKSGRRRFIILFYKYGT
jgi:hypothetical protein